MMMLRSSVVGFVQINQYELIQPPTRSMKGKGIVLCGHRCGASHGVSNSKISEQSLGNRKHLVIKVYVPCLELDRTYI